MMKLPPIAVAALCVSLCGTCLFAKKTEWKVKGYVKVKPVLDELRDKYGSVTPLKRIQVRVKARYKVGGVWGTWASWGTVRTNSYGYFEVVRKKNNKNRQFKVQVKFDDNVMELRHAKSTSSATKVKWYTVFSSSKTYPGPVVDTGTLSFGQGAHGSLGEYEPMMHANLWLAGHLLVNTLKSFGKDYAFTRKLVVKYPHNSKAISDSKESSYANPLTKVIYLFRGSGRDHGTVEVFWHEAMHIWMYTHCTGETGLIWQLIANGSTHGLQKKSFVSFHEGFAEYAKDKLYQKVFPSKYLKMDKPYTRYYLYRHYRLTSTDSVARHDEGWRSIFHLLTTKKLEKWRFYTKDNCDRKLILKTAKTAGKTYNSPDLSFKDILRSMMAKKSAGYRKNIKKSEMNLSSYLKRLAAICPGFSSSHIDKVKKLIDPAGSVEPAALFAKASSRVSKNKKRTLHH